MKVLVLGSVYRLKFMFRLIRIFRNRKIINGRVSKMGKV